MVASCASSSLNNVFRRGGFCVQNRFDDFVGFLFDDRRRRRGRRNAALKTAEDTTLVVVAKRKASSRHARKVQLREEARDMQMRREERERKEREALERRPEPPARAVESAREADERVKEADAKFRSAVDSIREMKKSKRESEEWDPQIGYAMFRDVTERVKEMNKLRVRTYETRLERAVFLIELAKALGNTTTITTDDEEEEVDRIGGINDEAVLANDVGAVGKTLDAFDWVYGKEVVDESNARTLEFMLRRKKNRKTTT